MHYSHRQRIDALSESRKLLLQERLRALAEGPQVHAPGGRLVAALVGNNVDVAVLRAFCESRLPPYMVPQVFVETDELPKTPAGKIDRQALQLQDWSADSTVDQDIVAPRSPVEEKLAAIWCDVLGFDDISVHDNFFEVGGDSLMTIRILSRSAKEGLKISPETFFANPTIAGHAESVANTQPAATSETADSGVRSRDISEEITPDFTIANLSSEEYQNLSAQLDALDDD